MPYFTVFIEHCCDCQKHRYCTWHNEAQYQQCFETIKEAIHNTYGP